MTHPIGTAVTFTVPHPVASSKNRKRIFARPGKRAIVLPSKQARDDIAEIRALAAAAARGMQFGPDDALRIDYVHDIGDDSLTVTVTKIGTLPTKGKRGTKRDVHGMLETVADAMQGVLYANDSAVDEFGGRRRRTQ